jgi:hypothetical protein
MRGPIDFIIVGFEGNKFDGSILKALGDAIDKGIIKLIALGLVVKDKDGKVTKVAVDEAGEAVVAEFAAKYKPEKSDLDADDITEVSDLLNENTAAGILAVEHVWAIPLKQAIIDAGGVLIADGRIHPDAAAELN